LRLLELRFTAMILARGTKLKSVAVADV